jgi:MFS family permease
MIIGFVGLDRIGKGIRTAPRDSIISLHTPTALLGTAFGVHRALDAAGALLGPLVAFLLLAQIPGAFDVLWIVSFIVACLGVAALWLFVPRRQPTVTAQEARPSRHIGTLTTRRFITLGACGTAMALLTISDAFLYLMLQDKSQTAAGFVPLFYVGTAATYMLFAVPAGLLADRYGRARVFAGGYAVLAMLYGGLTFSSELSLPLVLGALTLLGLYYAATEGVLMALASAIVSPAARATGLALIATSIGLGKLLSSLAFGWIWQAYGAGAAIATFAIGAVVALVVIVPRLGAFDRG